MESTIKKVITVYDKFDKQEKQYFLKNRTLTNSHNANYYIKPGETIITECEDGTKHEMVAISIREHSIHDIDMLDKNQGFFNVMGVSKAKISLLDNIKNDSVTKNTGHSLLNKLFKKGGE